MRLVCLWPVPEWLLAFRVRGRFAGFGMALRVRLLGRLGLDDLTTRETVEGSLLPGRQGRLAFAYLTLNPFPVSRDDSRS